MLWLGRLTATDRNSCVEKWNAFLSEHYEGEFVRVFDFEEYWSCPNQYDLFRKVGNVSERFRQGVLLSLLETQRWPMCYDTDAGVGEQLGDLFPNNVRLVCGGENLKRELVNFLVDCCEREKRLISLKDDSESLEKQNFQPPVVIIENCFVQKLKECSLLSQLICRRSLAKRKQIQVGDDSFQLPKDLFVFFVTPFQEFSTTTSSSDEHSQFNHVNFQSSQSDLPFESVLDLLIASHNPNLLTNWNSLIEDRLSMLSQWRKTDFNFMQHLLNVSRDDEESSAKFCNSEHQVAAVLLIKNELLLIERRLAKSREQELLLVSERKQYDAVALTICGLASALGNCKWFCGVIPQLPTSELKDLLQHALHSPSPTKLKLDTQLSLWSRSVCVAFARSLWSRCSPGLPREVRSAFSFYLSMGVFMPHNGLRSLLTLALLKCPLLDKDLIKQEDIKHGKRSSQSSDTGHARRLTELRNSFFEGNKRLGMVFSFLNFDFGK